MTVVDAVRDLHWAHWGEPSRRAQFEVGEFSIEVHKWAADATPEGAALYATLGASARPMFGRDRNHRVEFFLGLVLERDDVASALAALGLYSAREGTSLDHGHTVPADGPLWPGTEMRTFLVLQPLSDFLPPLGLPDGLHVDFLQAVPLFDAERASRPSTAPKPCCSAGSETACRSGIRSGLRRSADAAGEGFEAGLGDEGVDEARRCVRWRRGFAASAGDRPAAQSRDATTTLRRPLRD
jgi:hypothetical protein